MSGGKLGDLGDSSKDSQGYIKNLQAKSREQGMDLKIDSINYIDPQLNQKKLKEWSNEFLGKYKKYKKYLRK